RETQVYFAEFDGLRRRHRFLVPEHVGLHVGHLAAVHGEVRYRSFDVARGRSFLDVRELRRERRRRAEREIAEIRIASDLLDVASGRQAIAADHEVGVALFLEQRARIELPVDLSERLAAQTQLAGVTVPDRTAEVGQRDILRLPQIRNRDARGTLPDRDGADSGEDDQENQESQDETHRRRSLFNGPEPSTGPQRKRSPPAKSGARITYA